jgi:hypothetical protein
MSNPGQSQKTGKGTIARIPPDPGPSEIKDGDVSGWFKQLYDPKLFSAEDLHAIYEAFRYIGFNREEVCRMLSAKFPDPRKAVQVVILIALRGPVASSKIPLLDGTTLEQLGVPSSGGQGKKILTCNKIQAATADLAAFYLKRLNAPKRINMELPGWLQFPSAGSIKLPSALRVQHVEFHKQFSKLIGGVFNEQIYAQMETNAYLDPALTLFEPP